MGDDAPRFDVPVLTLTDVTAGEIIPAARQFFDGESSVNRDFFDRALEAGGQELYEQALFWWRCCLQAGDSMAVFAIGYTLYDLERFDEALPYLRRYVEISPHGAWNWCWLGKGEQAVGNFGRARRAYERAIELSRAGEEETDAPELLAELKETARRGRKRRGDGADPAPALPRVRRADEADRLRAAGPRAGAAGAARACGAGWLLRLRA